jgi:hypothetical protein
MILLPLFYGKQLPSGEQSQKWDLRVNLVRTVYGHILPAEWVFYNYLSLE